MKRLFWLALGATLGVIIMRKLSKAAARLTPGSMAQNIAAGLADLADSLRDFADDVREAMSEREAELRESAGMDGTLGKVTE